MIVIGITGSIGMGKTTAADMLRNMGIPVHDSDAAVHALLGPDGAGVYPVADIFPDTLKKDREGRAYIDRGTLGRTVFDDAGLKKSLENILHPMVRADSDRFRATAEAEGRAMIGLDIPLLFETGAEKRVDYTICVTADAETQRKRVLARPGMTVRKFDRILATQMPDAEKRNRADFIISSENGFDDMRQQLENVITTIKNKVPHA